MFWRLPKRIRALARQAYRQFLADPHHPALRNHALKDSARGRHRSGSRSVSVTMKYRAIYVVEGGLNLWYWIGSHNDYENFIGKK
jgi:hypothetical protein